jgi:hypothetical protein
MEGDWFRSRLAALPPLTACELVQSEIIHSSFGYKLNLGNSQGFLFEKNHISTILSGYFLYGDNIYN